MLYNEDEVLTHLLKKYPEEGCGILQIKKGKMVWIPCENEAEDPEENFVLPSKEYLKASITGDIYAIVHSHPNASAELSEADKKASDFLGIPYIVYSIPEVERVFYTPQNKKSGLVGREYKFGENDCYSLMRDYYQQELGIYLPTQHFEDNWWDLDYNYFDDLFEKFGFREVQVPKIGDAIIFQIYCHVPNHIGVYLGEDVFIHHAVNRLSCRENLFPLWNKYIKRYIRHAKC